MKDDELGSSVVGSDDFDKIADEESEKKEKRERKGAGGSAKRM